MRFIMTDALIFLAPGYEEVEMLTVVDMVRRAGLVIDMVSITDTLEVTSSHNVTIKADKLFKEADFDSAKMIILPDRKSTRLNSSHKHRSRMPSSA